MLILAHTILTMTGDPIPRGRIRVEHKAITAVGSELQPEDGEDVIDLSGHILLPGLVNAHTHLDLSALAAPTPRPPDFPTWIQWVIDARRTLDAATMTGAFEKTLPRLMAGGTTTVGDIVGDPLFLPTLVASPLRGVAYVELRGNHRSRVTTTMQALTQFQLEHPSLERFQCRLSPHAPFSLLRAELHHALVTGERLAIHCGETAEEWALFTTGGGALARTLQPLGFEYGAPARSPIDYLERNGGIPRRSALIHGNYLHDEDYALLRARDLTVVHCPPCHRYFDRSPFDASRLREEGVRIALGTDSAASATTLSMLETLRLFQRAHPTFAAHDILAMATIHGATALGVEATIGSLEVGKAADLIAVPADQRPRPKGRGMTRKRVLDPPQAAGKQAGKLGEAKANRALVRSTRSELATPASTASVRGAQAGKLVPDGTRQTAREFDSARSASELVPSGFAGGGGRREPPMIDSHANPYENVLHSEKTTFVMIGGKMCHCEER